MSDWNSRGSSKLKFSCIRFTWVATEPWSIAINPIKKIQRVPVVLSGEGHNLNLKDLTEEYMKKTEIAEKNIRKMTSMYV